MAGAQSKSGWLQNLSVQSKIVGIIALLLACFLVSLGVTRMTVWRIDEQRASAEQLTAFIKEVNASARAINRRQIALMRAAFSPTEPNLQYYRTTDATFTEQLDQVRKLAGTDSILVGQFERVRLLNDSWKEQVASPVVAMVSRSLGSPLPGTDLNAALGSFLTTEITDIGSRGIAAGLDQMLATSSARLEAAQDDLEEGERLLGIINLSALLTALCMAAAAIFMMSRLVSAPLRHVAQLMERLAAHDHSIVVTHLDRRDEVGTISRALQVFKAMAIETYDNNWVKTELAGLSRKLQETKESREFAQIMVREVSGLVGAGVGVFYSFDPDTGLLELRGSYGYKERRHVSPDYRLGEGLVGQCALERSTIVLSPVPEDYVRIHSGTGEANPRAVFVLPIVSKDQLLGVLELATFEPLQGRRLALVEELAPLAAISLDNLMRARRTLALLKQTQEQTAELRAAEEELRSQQEELRTTNEQMHAQSQRLIASEEQLRVQAKELQQTNDILRHNAEELEKQKANLAELQSETQTKADDLARANQYKSQFLANMSHELRTPLNSLLILAHDLSENRSGNLDEDQIEAVSIIHDSGANLLRLINEILDLSKVEAGKMELVREPLQVADFARRMERNFRHMADEKGLAFTIDVAPDVPPVIVTDDGKLEQITNNLLGNAFKFTASGSVTVAFTHCADLPGGGVAIEVTDSGIGIPPQKLDTIFEAFEQVDASTRRQYGGTGLGLAISRRLAILLGGDVTVRSTEGAGSTFRLTLPVAADAEGQAAAAREAISPREPGTAAPAAHPIAGTPERPAYTARPQPFLADDRNLIASGDKVVLIIEDDTALCRSLMGIVRRKGYRVVAASDGETGLAFARTYNPTGILLDVMLPGMDGWQVIEALKRDPATRHIPVHFLSALEEAPRAREAGAVGFLTKPVSQADLNGALERLMHFAADRLRQVLVVDDDPTARFSVRKLIASASIEVREAGSAEEALTFLGQHEVDCIVLDLGLPGMSGFQLVEELAARGSIVPVVIYSARDLTPEESLRLRAYTDSIVIKGARSPERLLDEVSLFLHSVRHAPDAIPPEPDGDLAGRKLLLVDDDMRNIFALSKVLRGKGITVILASDGTKALTQLADHPDTEIVLMDIMMPVMDGYEAMGEIRKKPAFAKLPIIALTAKAMTGDREKCIAAGASDYLSKPIDVPKLLSMIRVWLARS
ncbi:response regulator [Roseixanthobacter glucoisosaccharinicivorans]|uniref:response regulator n=1 Tax=Roseixanthobacter glucoisosaccharinicivorans TaxID=3119923 RepID=UPI003728350B